MSDTGIPKTGSGVPPLPQQRPELSARVENATGDLAHLLRPTRIEGIITGQSNGLFHIRTERGDLDVRLRGAHSPANGQKVEVELHAGHPPRQAVVRAVQDQTTQSPSPRAAQAAAAQTAADTSSPAPLSDSTRAALSEQAPTPAVAQPSATVTIQPGDLVRLAPMTPEEAEATIAETIISKAALQAPATLVFKTTAEAVENLKLLIELPTDQGAALRPRAPGESAHVLLQPRISSLPVVLEATAAPLAKAITPLAALDVRITGVTQPAVKLSIPGAGEKTTPSANPFFSASMPATALDKAKAAHAGQPLPTTTMPPAPTAGPAGSLSGTVIGHTSENFPVLAVILPGQTLPAHFALQLNTDNLPDGAVVNFIPHAAATDLPDTVAPPQSSDLVPAFQWAALSNIKAVVTQIDPRIVQAFTQTLPNAAAPEQIPAAALFFVAAVRSGDIASWLGDKTIEALRRAGRSDTIDKLSKEMNDAGKAEGGGKAAGAWHSLPMPIVAGGDIQRMMLYYRHDRGKEGESDGEGQRMTRFIFDMDLTRMGVVQLDGLHRPAGKESKLDLIVRTGAPLSPTMQQSMRRAYTKALESTGHSGEMSFQHRPEQFVKVGKGA